MEQKWQISMDSKLKSKSFSLITSWVVAKSNFILLSTLREVMDTNQMVSHFTPKLQITSISKLWEELEEFLHNMITTVRFHCTALDASSNHFQIMNQRLIVLLWTVIFLIQKFTELKIVLNITRIPFQTFVYSAQQTLKMSSDTWMSLLANKESPNGTNSIVFFSFSQTEKSVMRQNAKQY